MAGPMKAAIAASSGADREMRVSATSHVFAGEIARLSLRLAPGADSILVSLEARGPNHPAPDKLYPLSSRHRFAVLSPALTGGATIKSSDVIMYYPGPSGTARSLNVTETLARMLPRSTVSAKEPVGMFWEVYGLKEGDEARVELSMIPIDSGAVLSAIGRSLGIVSPASTTVMGFTSPPIAQSELGADGEKVFSLVVNLTSLKPGMYVLEVATAVGSNDKARARRIIRVSG